MSAASSRPSLAARSEADVPEGAAGPSFYRFLRLSHILGSVLREILEDRFLAELSPHRLTRVQFCFLKLVALNADLKVGELARCLGVSAAASSKTINKLERLGLVTRETSPTDRRASLLSASERGRRLVAEYERLKASRIAPVVAALGEERADRLCTLLEEVCIGLLEEEHPLRGPCLRCAGYYHADCSVASVQEGCALRRRRDAARSAVGQPA